ncbi:MAG: STAS domain-containing protein [bacterium]|nr:STAS domain-containing protein [bacterium]
MADVTITFSNVDGLAGTKLIKFSGQLDETNIEDEAKKVYAVLDGEKPKNLIFDFSELSYLNSKSIGYISDWQSKISQAGGKVVIFGAQPNIFDILDVVGLTKLIDLVEHLDEARTKL